MLLQFEITDDQLELLKKIKELPSLLKEHLNKLPQSFPGSGSELERIKELCEQLEFKWKKWIIGSLVAQEQLKDLVSGIVVAKKGEYLDEKDL